MIVDATAKWIAGQEAVLNSNFTTSIIGALAGAFFGAWGAQKIAEKAKRRDDLLKEIRNTNAAIMLAFAICNSVIALKKQHVKSLKEQLDNQRIAFACHNVRELLAGKRLIFTIQFNLMTLSSLHLPLEVLEDQIFEKLSLVGRPLALMAQVRQSAMSLEDSNSNRNELVREFRKRPKGDQAKLLADYLGVPLPGSRLTDQNYADYVNAIFSQTDDLIAFSRMLAEDLIAHGESLSKKFKSEFGIGIPIHKPAFEKPEVVTLLPDESNYSDWREMFVKARDVSSN
ncbi:hypothetical protein BH10PSE10_BH10PSE10_02920 [soil metagenome]